MQLAHAGRKGSSHGRGRAGSRFRRRRRLADGGAVGGTAQGRRGAAARVRYGRALRACATLSSRPQSVPSGLASTPSNCTPRTAISCISSCRRSPTSAPTNMAGPCKTACVIRWKCSRRSARFFPGQAGRHQGVGDRLGRGRLGPPADHRICKELKKRGPDWIDVSSGGVSPLQKIPRRPGYQVPFAQAGEGGDRPFPPWRSA